MHRFLERFSAFAGTAVVFVYLFALFLGTATYFAGKVIGVDLQAAAVTAFALAAAFEVHSFLSQRLTRFWFQTRAKLDATQPEWDVAETQFRVHLWITVGLVFFSAFNSIAFWALVLNPKTFGDWMQCIIRGAVTPAAFLAAGFLTPLQHDAAQMLQGASATMLRKAMKITIKQWQRRLESARKQNVNLAPVAVALMEDAHESAAARRLAIIDAALTRAEGNPAVRTHAIDAPERPPTGPGSPIAATGASAQTNGASVTTARQEGIRLVPASRLGARGSYGRGVRTASAEARARAAWVKGARSVGELERAAGVTRSTAGKYRRTFMAEEATKAQAAQ